MVKCTCKKRKGNSLRELKMKLSQLNQNEATAIKLIREHYNDIVGGLENTLLDYEKDSEEYIDAKMNSATPREWSK